MLRGLVLGFFTVLAILPAEAQRRDPVERFFEELTGPEMRQPRRGGAQWVYCAPHEGFCRVPYPTTVRYGAQGAFASQQVSRGIQCNQNVFGDPIRGVAKACFYLAQGAAQPYAPPQQQGSWRPCAGDFQFCEFSGTAMVRYGAQGIFTERRASNGIMCEPRSFGRDPVPNVRKQCFVRY